MNVFFLSADVYKAFVSFVNKFAACFADIL